MAENPEIGRQINAGGLNTNYHDIGAGRPVFFIHGSGPGVSAWANWRLNLQAVADHGLRCIAPDMAGFGYTELPAEMAFSRDAWVEHFAAFADALAGGERISIVGNSYGGAIALAYAIRFPERVDRLVLMGAVGLDFPITAELDKVWGHVASREAMRDLMKIFAWDQSLVNDDLAELRHLASIRPGMMEAFSAMFPEPRQAALRALASREEDIARVQAPTLIIHGRDDRVIPVDVSKRLFELLANAELHLFRKCGHWTQIEKAERFNAIVGAFLR
ncbi:alpha/beta fold hydrolase [Sinisalibacter aestuarii]|uniref:2,6-dioxo-6-phenylhexa-3-enoate hydrolase n=1 Tax=Sinisalibacter aestuarii TaxID=2949426 RepID=A0ABQ5M007_9RHOB|nr:alpha/beta hydrolase [Sinisalibacter aestuarii]GKY90096.1 2,6-dioxo-6-phenylhexa-3-enoate hydrolase [Sinisalibacter aestuarii]